MITTEKEVAAKGSSALLNGLTSKKSVDAKGSIESNPGTKVPGNKSAREVTKFVYIDELLKALNLAFISEENIILFGKGGHGKSEVSEHFFKSKGIEPFVKTMGSGTTTDSLFGGIDIKSFNETGKLEYLVENSFMNHEYVIFEELFDAPDYILEQLKDILTSRKFRNGSQVFEIKTKLIVCCTNKTREDFAKNDSLKALMERFPLEYKVEWNAYTRTTYEYMFNKMFGKSYSELSYLLEKLHANGTTVSPRTAIKAARIIEVCGGDYGCLDFIAEFTGKNSKLVKAELAKFKNVKIIEDLFSEINQEIAQCNAIKLDSLTNIKEAKALLKNIAVNITNLKSKKVDDELMKEVNGKVKGYEQFVLNKGKEITNATEI